jgi:hypothetical protein
MLKHSESWTLAKTRSVYKKSESRWSKVVVSFQYVVNNVGKDFDAVVQLKILCDAGLTETVGTLQVKHVLLDAGLHIQLQGHASTFRCHLETV